MSPPTPTTPTPPTRDPSPAQESFEDLLAQLEDIIHRVESGEVGLERSISEYERGVGLVRRCRDILSQAEQKVEELSRTLATPQDAAGRSAAGGSSGGGGSGGR